MEEKQQISSTKLLYDPLFAEKPDVDLKGRKNLPFKIGFTILITIFVGLSLFFSFSSLSNDTYEYKTTENGIQLYQFNGKEEDSVMSVDYIIDEDGNIDKTQSVNSVRKFAVTCNEYVEFIFIGKDVTEIDAHSFYYLKNLKAVIVDEANKYYSSVDGVLFNKDKTEIILHPIKNNEYRACLKSGYQAPSDVDSAEIFILKFNKEFGEKSEDRTEEAIKKLSICNTYEIPDTVTKIGDSCFSDCEELTYIKIPSSVKTVGSLAFFKCKGLETLYIPDGVEEIGSDGFSYTEKLTYIYIPASVKKIGHHAFYGCLGCSEIYLGAQSEDDIEIGDNWLPKKSKKTLKTIDAIYGQERRTE